ncbi:MAG: hypothetical protein WC490_06640 [Candidatus Margulisiibacteriota bacterium]
MENIQLSKLTKKIDIIVNLLLEKRQKENKYSDEDQALYLSSFGLSPSEIGALLAKSSNAARVLLAKLRKKGRLQKYNPMIGENCARKK